MHIGSGPGVVGLSGMQVKLPVPWRTVRMVPSGPMTTMVAIAATDLGAAVIALEINFRSDAATAAGFMADAGIMAFSAAAASESEINDAPAKAQLRTIDLCILLLPHPIWFERVASTATPFYASRTRRTRAKRETQAATDADLL